MKRKLSIEEASHYYILSPGPDDAVGKIPIPADLETWAAWFGTDHNRRVVQQDHISDFWISTVFLGIDHNFSFSGPPVLFETMIFNKDGDSIFCQRYTTWELALEGHRRYSNVLEKTGVPPESEEW